ncbi:SGNH/GDSL hydrolase family protein [Nonomuraea sp. NPDC048882]|uniref:SGNH/GDSL hydrolase family protein n=1 Tax=unclassified Nonomuraea TaxID=2593643 RepID=UPI000B13D884
MTMHSTSRTSRPAHGHPRTTGTAARTVSSPLPPAVWRTLALIAALAIPLAGCSAQAGAPDGSAGQSAQTQEDRQAASEVRVLWMGDSIAGAQAPALEAALEAGGVTFMNATSDGGGNVVAGDHPVTKMGAKSTWKTLREHLTSFRPTVVAYQITTYDWGSGRQQLAAYRKLAKTAEDGGARLVLVSAPPFKIDDFFRPHAAAIKSAPRMAARAADAENARYLDASQLWGTDHSAERAQRSKDGIHSCQQGSAAFATWFAKRLGELTEFTPAAPATWATGSWTGDERYVKLGCG